jgi:thioredoxin-related protein
MNKMKRIIFILLLALHGVTVFSQGQTLFVDKKYDESLSLSKIEKKPLVIFFYAKWCPHCNVMKKEVFTDSTVTALYRKNFVLMGVDAESEYGKELKTKFQDKFRILSFPTFAFLDNNENLLYCTSGELKKERFLSEGNSVVVPENQIPNIKEAFYSDPSNADKCLKYITVMKKAGFETTKIAQKYLSTIKPEERFTEINWRIFANGINNFDTDEFKFVIQNKDAFSKALSASRIDKKIVYTVSETLRPLVETADTINYNKKRIIAEGYHIRKIDSLLYRSDLQILSQTNNWKKYQKITADNVENFSWKDTVVLYDICNTYYEAINDKKALLQAAKWSKHLLTLGESLDRYVLASKLLMKLKDYKQALDFAQKGKALADSLGLNAIEINTVIADIKKQNL